MSNTNSKEIVKIAVEAMKDKKASDVKILDISKISVIADYFIIADGNNGNQIQAIVDNIQEKLHEAGVKEPRVEGYNTATWVLLDYNDVIIHIFNKEDRLFYDLDRIWRDGIFLIGKNKYTKTYMFTVMKYNRILITQKPSVFCIISRI